MRRLGAINPLIELANTGTESQIELKRKAVFLLQNLRKLHNLEMIFLMFQYRSLPKLSFSDFVLLV